MIDSPRHLRRIVNSPQVFQIYGEVSDWPDLKPDRTEITIAVDSLTRADRAAAMIRDVDGRLLLKVSDTTTALQRGDRIALIGRIYPIIRDKEIPGFDYGRFLHLRGIHGVVYLPTLLNVQRDRRPQAGLVAMVDGLRDAIRHTFARTLGPTSAALASGFLIGETRDIPPDLYRMFRDSGTLHLLAVSGSNVALVLLFLAWVMRPLGLKPSVRAILLLATIVIFAMLSYGDPSVIRASVMAALVIGARWLGRPFDLNNIIALTAVIILAVAPAQLYDVGFQLSFITAWGLIFFVPKLTPYFGHRSDRWWYRYLVFPLIVCLVAQVCSTPIVAYHFGRIPWLSLPANLLIVPLVAVGVVALMVLLAVTLVHPLLGLWVGSLVDLLLRLVVHVLTWFGHPSLPPFKTGDLLRGEAGLVVTLVTYLLLLLAGLALTHRLARRLFVVTTVVILNLGLGFVLVHSWRTPEPSVEAHPIPGGALGVIGCGDSASDLVITSLDAKGYPLDERVFLPLFERLGIDRARRLFVLEADYDALDDIARLAILVHAERLCLESGLSPSWSDLTAHIEYDNLPPVDFFGGAGESLDSLGIIAVKGAVHLVLPNARVSFAADPEMVAKAADSRQTDVLVLGERRPVAASDVLRLRALGYSALVCSKFEQGEGFWPDDETNPDFVPPEFVHDLTRRGRWILSLAD